MLLAIIILLAGFSLPVLLNNMHDDSEYLEYDEHESLLRKEIGYLEDQVAELKQENIILSEELETIRRKSEC